MIELMLESQFSDFHPPLLAIGNTTYHMNSAGILLHFEYNLILMKSNLHVHFQDKEFLIV